MNINPIYLIIFTVIIAIACVFLGSSISNFVRIKKLKTLTDEANKELEKVKSRGQEAIRNSKQEAQKIRAQAEQKTRDRRSELQRSERRIAKKEEQINKRLATIWVKQE